jgi:hypothetical protein
VGLMMGMGAMINCPRFGFFGWALVVCCCLAEAEDFAAV